MVLYLYLKAPTLHLVQRRRGVIQLSRSQLVLTLLMWFKVQTILVFLIFVIFCFIVQMLQSVPLCSLFTPTILCISVRAPTLHLVRRRRGVLQLSRLQLVLTLLLRFKVQTLRVFLFVVILCLIVTMLQVLHMQSMFPPMIFCIRLKAPTLHLV